ncbi:unnamed protein product [Lepidochelys olivacea]
MQQNLPVTTFTQRNSARSRLVRLERRREPTGRGGGALLLAAAIKVPSERQVGNTTHPELYFPTQHRSNCKGRLRKLCSRRALEGSLESESQRDREPLLHTPAAQRASTMP